ncbi:MAG: YkgJ family cysteine cluster protein [Bdellovibrionaceae bacterium]|nr:YkgJ family cysteine cluster protein [Pseudobdellovibrionaceae bacterium]
MSFSRDELLGSQAWKVPRDVVEDPLQKIVSLKGTTKPGRPSCAQLKGRIGKFVACQIYTTRPTPCRNFKASFEDGIHRPRCDEARKAHGLKSLNRSDWNNTDAEL